MAYIGRRRRKGMGNKKRRSILGNWGVGIFYSDGYKPGYPAGGKERSRHGNYRNQGRSPIVNRGFRSVRFLP